MALITYLTRVHFADGILEEALRSELEQHGLNRPVIVAECDDFKSDIADRLFSGLPIRTFAHQHSIENQQSTHAAIKALSASYVDHDADCLIAFGKARIIQLAQLVRAKLVLPVKGKERMAEGSNRRRLPDLFAIAGVDGLTVSPSLAPIERGLEGTARYVASDLVPTAIICDPTLTLGASHRSSASAGVSAVARCIEAYLSNAYNPPADGIALDGLQRLARNLHRVLDGDRLDVRREMMAATLNGTLAQQKGFGTAQLLAVALNKVSSRNLDQGALERLLLPGILGLSARDLKEKYQPIRHILGVKPRQSLADGVRSFFERLPLPPKLSDMGITDKDIEKASSWALEDSDISLPAKAPKRAELTNIMHAVL